jgi:hypothetical protein
MSSRSHIHRRKVHEEGMFRDFIKDDLISTSPRPNVPDEQICTLIGYVKHVYK